MKPFDQTDNALKSSFGNATVPVDNLSGEGFKQSIVEGVEACKTGQQNEFVKINRDDLWK